MRPDDARYRGTAREHFVAAKLLAAGFNVARPALDSGADLWVETAVGIRRIQVKSATLTVRGSAGGRWCMHAVGGRQKRGGRRRALNEYRTVADFFVIVKPDLTLCWIVPTAACETTHTFTLRPQWVEAWESIGEVVAGDLERMAILPFRESPA